MALVTRADVKTYLGISSTNDDDVLNELINAAQGLIESFTHRKFDVALATSKYFDAEDDVENRKLLFTEGLEICAAPTAVTNGDGTSFTVNTDYVYLPRNDFPAYGLEILQSSSNWWQGKSNGDMANAITVTAQWGYSSTPPNDIVQAARRLSAFLYRQRDTNADTDRPIIVDGVTILPSALPKDVERMLLPYVLRTN